MSHTLQRLREAIPAAHDVGERRDLLARFAALCDAVDAVLAAPDAPERVRAKATAFAALLESARERLGPVLWQPSYLLNVVGDAVVRTDWVFGGVVEFLQVGLYFHGLRVIERRFSHQSIEYCAVHADLLASFTGRAGIKAMTARGRAKIADGRVFCLTYDYLNELRKARTAEHRRSAEALDHVRVEADPEFVAAESDVVGEPTDRVGLMMSIFAKKLSAMQQLVYLAKNRAGGAAAPLLADETLGRHPLVALLAELDGELDGHGNLGWSEIAERLHVNEKTAKREYLKALHVLLSESARSVFGAEPPSRYVSRVLQQIREVVDAKDLRIRSSTGEGLGRLVEKWETALRFVLNHHRVSA